MNKKVIIFFLCLFPVFLFGQARQGQNFQMYEDSLKHLGARIVNHPEEVERKNANYNFIRTLISTLKLPGSFRFKFDSVKSVSIINSPDDKFRIFTWHVMNDDGSYRFYGTIQINTGSNGLQLHPLGDYSPFMKSAEDTVTDNTKWFGAQYYQIVPVGDTNPYYVLLGWKGFTPKSTKKVIEVLSFKNGKPVFGAPVFTSKTKTKSRVVFQYSRQASMLLKYEPNMHLLVFDHLAPPDKKMKDHLDTYGPDLSYDGYRLRNGKWQLEEDVDMRNAASAADEQYIDPRKKPQQ